MAFVVGVGVLPLVGVEAQAAVAQELGAVVSDGVRRAAFVGQEVDDGAAEAAAVEMGAEVSGEDTGADGGAADLGSVPEGANPLLPEPGTSVLPERVMQEGSAELITVEGRGPPETLSDDPEVSEPDVEDEVVAKRTERSKTFSNGDGTFTTESSIAPMHVEYRGGWEEIDVELREGVDGGIENGMAPVEITLADDGASDELAVVGLDGGTSVAYGLVGAGAVEPEVEGAVATYEEILPGVDLELESIPGGLKETAVLASVDAPSELTFTLELEGLTATLSEHGGVNLTDFAGVVRAAIPPGFMVDSAPGDGARSDDVGFALEEREGEQVLVVTPDRGWLEDPARVWPVRVDPTTVDRVPFDDTYVKQSSAADRSGALELRVGPEGGLNTAAYMNFSLGVPANSFISGATLFAHNTYSAGGCTAKPVSLYRVAAAWTGSTMTTWPGASVATPAVDTRSFANGGGPSCPSGWAAWDMTGLVTGWTRGSYPNHGISLRVPSAQTGDAGTGKRFTSMEGSSQDAFVRVTWSPWGAQYNPGATWAGGQQATNNTTGWWPIQIRNVGSATWVAGSDVKLATRVYQPGLNGTGTPVVETRTALPHNVSPQQLFGMNARVPALPPGTYEVFFEMVKEGDFWFSSEDPWNPRLGVAIQVVNQVPQFVSNAPDSGDVVHTRQPRLSVVADDPDDYGFAIQYFFRICPGPNPPTDFPRAVTGCQSSGWQNADDWTPPDPLPRWNETAYWWAFLRDGTGTEPHFAAPAMVIPTPSQGQWAELGRATASASDGGVDVRTGSFTSSATDLSVGWGPSTFAITRTYNSAGYLLDGAMGRGWSSILDVRLDAPPGTSRPASFTLFREDGRRETWARDTIDPNAGEEVYKGPLGSADTLVWDLETSRYVWRTADRTEFRFSAAGYLESIARPGLPDITVERSSPWSPRALAFQVGATTVSIVWDQDHVSSIRTTGHSSDARWRYTYNFSLSSVCDPRPVGERGCHTYEYQDFPTSINGMPKGPLSIARNEGVAYLQLQHELDQDPRVQWRRDGEGHQWTYAYGTYSCPGSGTSTTTCRRATVTQPNPSGVLYPGSAQPLPVVFDFDRNRRLVKRTNERGLDAEWRYDALGFLVHELDENTIGRVYWHDTAGHLTAVMDTREAHPTAPVRTITVYEYPTGLKRSDPRWGLPIRVYDPRVSDADRVVQEATRLTYDTKGRVIQRRSPATADAPDGRLELFTYMPDGQPGAGQLRSSTDQVGRTTTNYYDLDGRLVDVEGPTGVRTRLTYDAQGRVASTREVSDAHPAGLATTMEYDEIGQLTRVTGPPVTNVVDAVARRAVLERTYDPSRRLVAETSVGFGAEPDRTMQWTDFDGNGRPTETIDPEGRVTTTEWTWRGQIRAVTTSNGRRVTRQYARTGQVARVVETDLVEDPNHDVVLSAFSYDPAGRLGTEVDARGASIDFTYWDDGRPRRATLTNYKATPTATPVQRVLSDVTYDLAGNPTIERTRNLTLSTTRTYDLANALTRVEAAGRYVSYDHRADGLLESMTVGDATHADVTQYGYTALPARHLSYTAQHRGGGAPTYIVGFDHDDRGLLTSIIEPNGRQTDMDYDALGRLVRTTGPAVTVESYGESPTTARPVTETGYNTFDEVIQEQAADGTTRTASYDLLGRPTALSLPPYSPAPGVTLDATTTFAYDDVGRTRTTTDELRGTTTVERFDHRGRVVEIEDPPMDGSGPGGVTAFVYNTAGDLVATMGPDGQVEEYTHDTTGRVTRARQVERYGTPGTYESQFVYDAEFDLVTSTPPQSSSVTYTHNVFGEQTSVSTTAAGTGSSIATTLVRDHRGRVVRTEDNLGRAQENVYDQLGLLTQTRIEDASTLLRFDDYTYDANLNLHSVSKPGPNVGSNHVSTTYQHDALGRLTSITEPGGLTTSYGYDANGRPVRSTDGNGNATWFTYTPWGDLESVVDPATAAHPAAADRTWTFTYEAPGAPRTSTAPGGVVRTIDYNARGFPIAVSGTGGDAPASQAMDYDATGRLIESTSPLGATGLVWDDRGNLIETSGVAGASTMRFDGAGRMTSRADAGASSTFTYWGNGLLKTATGDQTGATEQYTYDATGALKTLTYPSGTTRTFTYDGFGNTASDTLATNGTTLATQMWTYGPDGSHLASTTAGPAPLVGSGVESYTYDGAGRLTTTTRPGSTVTTTWDGAGNRLTNGTTTATYDERNRLLTTGPPGATETYSWTPRGTLDAISSAEGTTDYQFDAFDRLTREVGPGVDDQYQWDSFDRLAAIDGAPMSYAGLERDPVAVPGQVFERDPEGGIRAFEPTGGTAQFIRSNHRGDASATFVPGATTVGSNRTYTPFGVPTSAGTPQPSFGYQGDWTSESGLVHMDARFYDPTGGAFISRDSWNLVPGPAAATNRYTYAGASPPNATDPNGHACVMTGRGAGNCITGGSKKPSYNPFGGNHCFLGTSRCGPSCPSVQFLSVAKGSCGGVGWFVQPSPPGSITGVGCNSNCGGSNGNGGGSSGTGGGSSGTGGGGRPTTPKAPPKPAQPWWITTRPTHPAPAGHLKPPASATQPIIEGSLTLYIDPTDVPTASYMPQASSVPTYVTLAASEGDSCTFEDRPVDADTEVILPCETSIGIVLPDALAIECLLSNPFGKIEDCPSRLTTPPMWEESEPVRDRYRNEMGDALPDLIRESAGIACSFSADTRVLMADGSTKPISEIEVGDWVVAVDPETGARGAQQVTHVWVHQDQLLDLRVGDEVVTTTEDHPFWNHTDQAWQPADTLDPGDQVLGSDGVTTVVGGLAPETSRYGAAHNLSVDSIHTYVVVVDDTEILVHNVDPRCRINGRLAGGEHPETGVPFDEDGFPDFSAWRHPDVPGLVRIVPSATRPTDARRANAAAGLEETPAGYVWHHHQDSGMMQLIEEKIHDKTAHTGGFSIWGGDSPGFNGGRR